MYPKNSFASAQETHNFYPYNLSAAKALLKSHGWTIVPGGVDTCAKPGTGAGECGAGIPAGAKLQFLEPFASGTAAVVQIVNAESSSWSQIGIQVHDEG